MDISLDKEIGKGFFGTVYKGIVARFAEYDTLQQDTPIEVHGKLPVAVKMLRGSCKINTLYTSMPRTAYCVVQKKITPFLQNTQNVSQHSVAYVKDGYVTYLT